MKDWYAVLGVTKDSTLAEIKLAYRKKAMACHPDKNPSPTAKAEFIEIDTAYRMLSDPTFKAKAAKQAPPKPKPKRNIWDADTTVFKDSMAGQYGGDFRPQRTYRPRPMPKPKPEPEPKLWWGNNDSMEGYWQEYNRLRDVHAYDDPEVFWEKLDEWVASRKKKKK